MERLTDADAIARRVVAETGGQIRLALPLGLGKPVTLVNALVALARDDPSISLTIFTALTLEAPESGSDMEARFLDPARDRLFGAYPELLYARMIRDGTLPDNIEVSEFFLLAGRWLGVDAVQQSFVSANYTHALDVLVSRKPNVLVQLVAEKDGAFSLSSNTDISADLFRLRSEGKLDFMAVAETNPQLPFLTGRGAVEPHEAFSLVLDPPEPFELFSAVKRPVDAAAHAIGLHVSRLVEDGGTLQIGIGSIGDSVAHALLLRHRGEIDAINADCPFEIRFSASGRFEIGLHAVTEMLVGGLLDLFEEGVIRREVEGRAIYAGFFVETRDFYRTMREMPQAQRDKIAMAPVSFTNSLYGEEQAKRAARVKARFVNGAMKVSLLGDVMSDALPDGRVVSGVGGQFNFVEQAMALEDGRSIITLPATRRGSDGELETNIAWEIASTTVPRHLRDIVVTEYGIANLWGQSDAEVIAALIEIADSRFQTDLIERAKKAGKLPREYTLPEAASRNRPATVKAWLDPHRDLLPDFPLGSDFNEIERVLLPALQRLKRETSSVAGYFRLGVAAFTGKPHPDEKAAMKRMGFAPATIKPSGIALRGALRMTNAE
jgi:acetyl-CoA hydrolase/transferase-like protein